jgi:hypothetical protein
MPAMQTPALIPLYGDRNVLFVGDMLFVGFNFTGAAMRMMVRAAPDAAGSALVTLSVGSGITISYAGTDTVQNHISAGRITAEQVPDGYALADSMILSVVDIQIAKATMAFGAIPAAENGDTIELAYDLLIAPSGGVEDKYAYGPFYVRGTVTYP